MRVAESEEGGIRNRCKEMDDIAKSPPPSWGTPSYSSRKRFLSFLVGTPPRLSQLEKHPKLLGMEQEYTW